MARFPITIAFYLAALSLAAFAQENDPQKMREGLSAYREERFADAATWFKEAARQNPADPVANFNLAAALYREGKYQEAGAALENATRSEDPALRQDAFFNQGNAYFKQEDYQKAVDGFRRALLENPDDPAAKHNLELAQTALKQQQKEEQEQQQDQEQDQERIEPSEYAKQLKARAELLVGQRFYRQGYDLMQAGLQQDETVAAFNDFIGRIDKVLKIEKGEGP